MDGEVALTRRGFLAGVVAVGALAACTRSGTAPAPAPPRGTASGSPAPLSIGVIGAGAQGRALASRLARDRRVSVVAVCDPDSERAASLADRLGRDGQTRPTEVSDLRRILDDDRIDAVIIATPHHWHVLAAIWALQAGKHVYLEKPATHNLAEGQPLLSAAGAAGRVVEVGTQRRSHPGLAEAIAALHEGAIGSVTHARCYSWKRRRPIGAATAGSWPAPLNADLWFGPRPIVPPVRPSFHYDWHWFYGYGNGGLGNNGVHRLDVARWGLQLPAQPLATLSLAGRLGPSDCGQTPNTALTVVQFPGATVAHDLRGLRTAPAGHDQGMQVGDEVVFVGDGASIVVTSTSGRLVDSAGGVVRRYGVGVDVDPTVLHLRRFVGACLDEDPTRVAVGPGEGAAAAAMCHAPSAAHRSGLAGTADVEQARAVIRDVCGPAMDEPTESFLAHVALRSQATALTWTGLRAVSAAGVAGVAQGQVAYPYRPEYRWGV